VYPGSIVVTSFQQERSSRRWPLFRRPAEHIQSQAVSIEILKLMDKIPLLRLWIGYGFKFLLHF
jgi:hypothetical protein